MKGGNEILHIKDRIKEKLQEWNGFWLDKDSASTSIIWALVFSGCILVLDSYGAFTYCKNQYGVDFQLFDIGGLGVEMELVEVAANTP